MTGVIQHVWLNRNNVLMAIIKTGDGQTLSAPVPAGSCEGQHLKQVDGVWRLIARAA